MIERARNFWFDFDNQTLFQRTQKFNAALYNAYFSQGKGLDWPAEALRRSYQGNNHPAEFLSEMSVSRGGLLELGDAQLEIINDHFNSPDQIQEAFELFGQGVLYDSRLPRPQGRYIHMMDGTPDDWVGWHRWYGCLRSIALLAPEKEAEYLHRAKCVALAWAIQTVANPMLDNPSNPGISDNKLAELRNTWMSLSWPELDWAFATFEYRAPDAINLSSVSDELVLNYSGVQQLLENAAGRNTRPGHLGEGRFWLKPYPEFINASIYGKPLIAPPGPDRGARSALVMILKGTLEGFPRMPLNRPPMDEYDIAYVEKWIDAGCPV